RSGVAEGVGDAFADEVQAVDGPLKRTNSLTEKELRAPGPSKRPQNSFPSMVRLASTNFTGPPPSICPCVTRFHLNDRRPPRAVAAIRADIRPSLDERLA